MNAEQRKIFYSDTLNIVKDGCFCKEPHGGALQPMTTTALASEVCGNGFRR